MCSFTASINTGHRQSGSFIGGKKSEKKAEEFTGRAGQIPGLIETGMFSLIQDTQDLKGNAATTSVQIRNPFSRDIDVKLSKTSLQFINYGCQK